MITKFKFRGKVLGEWKWVYGDYTQGSDVAHYITTPTGSVWQVDPNSVTPFAFYKDKNDKELYAGDICDYYPDESGNRDMGSMGVRLHCVFDETVAAFVLLRFAQDTQQYLDKPRYYNLDELCLSNHINGRLEIIGNVFDNKELTECKDSYASLIQ